MVCAKENAKESAQIKEPTPLVDFLVNNTQDATELA